jgi:hypothetical protein
VGKTKAQRAEEDRVMSVMEQEFANHELVERTDIPIRIFEIFRRGKDGSKSFCHRNFLVFVPGMKVIIFGDTFLTRIPFREMPWAVSENGYDLGWFASKLNPDYLREKFQGSIPAPLSGLQKAFSRLYHTKLGTNPEE